MLYLLIFGLLFLLIFGYAISRDVISPIIINCAIWLIPSLLLLVSNFNYNINSNCYLIFFIGALLFDIGFMIVHGKFNPEKRLLKNNQIEYSLNFKLFKIILFVESLFVIYLLVAYARFIMSNYGQNIFLSYYENRNSFDNLLLISYVRVFIISLTIAIIIIYPNITNEYRNSKKLFIMQIILGIVCTVTNFTRNGVLQAILPLLISYVISFQKNNKYVFRLLVISFTAFMIFFIYIASSKYWYLFDNNNFFSVLQQQISIYTSSPLVAFEKVYDYIGSANLGGTNTFRFFLAIFDKFNNTNYAVPLVQDMINVGGGITNVYTFYYYYYQDFGIYYPLVIQFLLGVFYGKLYKDIEKQNLFAIFIFSVFMYPLIMQFFQDQYFSLMSTWLQYIFFGLLFFKTNMIIGMKKLSKR